MEMMTIPSGAIVGDDDSLEALLDAQIGQANDEGDAVATEQDAGDDEEEGIYEDAADASLSDLDALLKESVATRNETVAAKAAKERLRKGGQSARERAEDQARLTAWEAAHEWVNRANVAYFERTVCQCGAVTQLFIGLMQRREHRHLRATMDWKAAATSLAGLPNEVAHRTRQVGMCAECASVKGWATEVAYAWEDR